MVSFKHFEIELLKLGKVSNHSTKAKIKTGKKEYHKGKIYFNNTTYIDKQFELYDIGEHKGKIALYYLPTYSQDLNPDEDVWKYLKNVKLKAHQAKNKEEFKPLVLSKMQSIQRKPDVIRSFFIGSLLY